MNIAIVTAAVIIQDGKVLITQRKVGVNQELKWEFPGGKMEVSESPEECLAREIKEELNINISVGRIFDVVYYRYPNITILLLAYSCEIIDGNPDAVDCNDFEWVSINSLDKYSFAEADIPIVNRLREC